MVTGSVLCMSWCCSTVLLRIVTPSAWLTVISVGLGTPDIVPLDEDVGVAHAEIALFDHGVGEEDPVAPLGVDDDVVSNGNVVRGEGALSSEELDNVLMLQSRRRLHVAEIVSFDQHVPHPGVQDRVVGHAPEVVINDLNVSRCR